MNPEIFDQLTETASVEQALSRRDALGKLARGSAKVALLSLIPLAGSSCAVVGKVIAPDTVLAVETLQFALMLEQLEHGFYVEALRTPGLIPASDRAVIEQISKHEGAHATFLSTGITGVGAVPNGAPHFDFTARGKYAGVFSNYRTFLEVAQMFEDNGVAAYKGQAANLITSSSLLTAALRIHSVEGRHAAEIRRLRGVKPWTGAFDEPASKATIMERTRPFIRSFPPGQG